MAWREKVSYPRSIELQDPWVADILDVLDELMEEGNIKMPTDRYSYIVRLTDGAKKDGFITASEHNRIMNCVGPSM